jgi:hypothetical protein
MYIDIEKIKTRVKRNDELKADFICALRDNDVETMRRIARLFLNSISYPKPEPCVPDDAVVQFWKIKSDYFLEIGQKERKYKMKGVY